MTSKSHQTAVVALIAAALLLVGCLGRSAPTEPPVASAQTTPLPPAVTQISATPTPLATATQVPPTATPIPMPTGTATPPATPTDAPAAKPDPEEGAPQVGFTEGGDPFKGDPEALVVVEEFSSYQCPYCARHHRETLPLLIANYVDTGVVRYVYRDFPLRTQPQSQLAAEAASCAGRTGGASAYWAMHDLLFERQAQWSGRADAQAIVESYAAEVVLDTSAFTECLASRTARDEVVSDAQEGASRGVRATPSFFINGRPLVGAQPYEAFAQAIGIALAEAKSTVELEMAPVSVLPAEYRQLPLEVQEAYRFAVANRDALEVMPCYCGCGGVGHENNHMCYVKSESPEGAIVFDSHAVT